MSDAFGVKRTAIRIGVIVPEDKRYARFGVEAVFGVAGGYYVVYEDGYKSFSPSKAFDEGYTLIP